MYREGPNGYNVPFGHYKTTPSINKSQIDDISNLIKDVNFINCDFTSSLNKVKKNDFVYLDPPYAPVNSKSFVGYVAGGFNLKNHKELFKTVKNLEEIKFVMSNSNVELVTDNFKEYQYESITARRAINSKKPGSTCKEVIIYN